eukprot:TRINITY_DN21669_c0_g1_i2.p1 TRINITY_DN21669_c0_g1~~TRINITY_DN21669_c0_g1_i2.p1  ORF type:complete len:1156 (-),score=367.81 TRINITY_DN21669_c0_g1_i2:274-3741(-)
MSSTGKDDQVRKIFVGGLDYDTVEATLEQYFGQWGPVSECTIKRFPDGKSRGFGFVTFGSLAAMENCFENQPHTIDGKGVDLRKAADSGPNSGSERSKVYDPEARELKKLFVGSLDYTTTEEELNEYFSKYGDVMSVAISKYPDSGKSRGFAFVTFQSGVSVDEVQQTRPHVMKGRKLETKRATPKHLVGKPESQVSTTKIFIGPPEVRAKGHSGLSEEITDEDLTEYFGQFGNLVKVQQMRWEDSGKKRGYGYVEFTDEDSVDKAVLVRSHFIRGREIEAKKALTRQQMKDIEEVKNNSGGVQNMNMNNMGMGNTGMGMNNLGMGISNMGMGMNNMGIMGGGSMGMGGNSMGMGGGSMGMGGGSMGMGGSSMGMMNNSMGMGMGMNNMGAGHNTGGGYGKGMRSHNVSSEQRGTKRPRTAVDLEAKIMRKLYVGNLDFGTSEDDIKAHFEQYGEVEEVNIHKFHDTGRSRGFGFITFLNSSGVDNVQMCRPHLLQGNTLDTKRALPKGENNSQDDVRVKKIFIGAPEDEKHTGGHSGLSDEIEDGDLSNYFSQYGVVTKVDQLRWKDSGKKRGYGYIEFDDEDTVDKVCLIGIHEVLGVRLEVKKAVEKHSLQKSSTPGVKEFDNTGAKRSRKEQVDPESKVMRKLFIGNLNLNTTEEKLKEYFEQFGSTELVQLPLHVDSGKARGFAFITFEKAASVDATQAARPHKLDGSFIDTTRATPKQDLGNPEAEAKVKKIFIGGAKDERVSGHSGLTDDISDGDLEDYFGQFGIVTKVEQKIWEDSGKKRGYGYIDFDDEDSVDKIVLLGVHIVKGVRLEAKKGLNKDQLKTKTGGAMNTGNRMGRMGSVGPVVNNMGGNMGANMHNNMKAPGFGSFMPNRGESNMGNMMGQMQSMMGSMNSGNMDKSNMMGNMQQMQKMMGNMQNNMGSGGMGSDNNMQMMQNMMNMQNMMGNMQKNNGNNDQSMSMMTSMQQMMMNMMSMCTQMMSQGMNNSPTPASGNSSSFSNTGNNSSMQRSSGSGFSSPSQGNGGSSGLNKSSPGPGYSSQGSTGHGSQGMNNYSSYGSSSSGSSYAGNASQGASRYSGAGMGQGNNSYSGMGNTSTGMGQGMNYSGMGSGNSTMGQQGNSGYSNMGNNSRGGGPVRGDMGANRGNPYSRN